MTEWKEYLKKKIEESKFPSVESFAEGVKVTPTSIYRQTQKGVSPSISSGIVEKMAGALKLEAEDLEEFRSRAHLAHGAVTPETVAKNPEELEKLFLEISGKRFKVKKTPKGLSVVWL